MFPPPNKSFPPYKSTQTLFERWQEEATSRVVKMTCLWVAKNLLKQATGTEKKHVLHSHPLLLLISFVVTYFSHFLLGLKHIDLGHGTKGEGGGGDAVRWWRGESKGWEEEEAGDSFWSQPLNKSVRARQKESMRETQRKTERERWSC